MGESAARGAWDPELLLKSVEEYHGSYMSIHWWPRVELEQNRDIIRRINLRLGYRLQNVRIKWPDKIRKGEPFTILSEWRNAGVAPCYEGGFPCFTIKDSLGGVVSVLVDESFDVKSLPVGEPDKAEITSLQTRCIVARPFSDTKGSYVRTCPTGTFDLYVSVGKADGTPVFALPYEGDDGHRRYRVGKITIVE